MAKIWFVKDGQRVHEGNLFKEEPFDVCVDKLGIERRHWRSERDFSIEKKVEGRKANLDPASRDPEFVVIEADQDDVASGSWKIGFYLPEGIRPNDARKKLGEAIRLVGV